MAGKQTKVSRRMLFTWLMLGGLILLIAPAKWTSSFQFAFLRVFRWPLSIGENISLSVENRGIGGDSETVSRKKYRELLNHYANMEARLRQEQAKVEQLTGVRESFALGNTKLVEALVYPVSIGKGNSEILIDKGADSSLAKGQFVLAENSIVGTISEVSTAGARVRLITSTASNMAVDIGGTKRFMRGTGDNLAKIPMMKNKIEAGTAVMAARKAGVLNTPITVGRVLRCDRNMDSAVLWDIIVEPACDIQQLNDVVVVVMNPQGQK
ncbi:MAG: rod shape-determining protein MreC [Sedimentisphaerales bacterium]|nr:rod shape-determining protein MreC [Sedimentisphaerales bacterium]